MGELDLKEERFVGKSKDIEIARDKCFHKYFECSSKTGENVEEIFESLARAMLEKALPVSH